MALEIVKGCDSFEEAKRVAGNKYIIRCHGGRFYVYKRKCFKVVK